MFVGFFLWLYCFYKCINSYWNDEIFVCIVLIRILSGFFCWRLVYKVFGLEFGIYFSEIKGFFFIKVKDRVGG